MARDRQSQGTHRPLSAGSYSLSYSGRAAGSTAQGPNAGWFGPLAPMNPMAPPSVKGRILDYPSGYNLNVRPRADERVTFEMLRAFSDSYDLLRLVIETRKDQMARLQWNIVPRDKALRKRGATIPGDIQTRIDEVTDFFRMPDKENFWHEWLPMVLEDLFVIDAPAIYRRRTIGGDLYALQAIDGGTIKRVIDDWGNTPEAPDAAYQQILKGYPAVEYTTEELIYRPRVRRTNKVYGYSPVEQIIMTINIGLRRQTWQLQSFTEGNMPEALIGTPATWTPDQVRQFQDWFDNILEGDTGARRKARFVPGDVAKGYVPTKPTELFGEGEEWLARVVCFAFNISPQPFVKMMNRATAETAQETAAMDGLGPIQNWTKGLIDYVLMRDFGYTDLEFRWMEEDELDPAKKSEIVDREQAAGRLSYNEARREQGLDPDPHPNADRPMQWIPASGWSPIFLTPEEEQAKADAAQALLDAKKPAPGDGGDEEADDDTKAPGDTSSGAGDTAPKAGGVAEKSDRPLAGTHKHGTGCGSFTKADDAEVPPTFADPFRPLAQKLEAKLGKKLAAVLKRLGKDVVKQIKAAKDPVAKADEPDYSDEIEQLLSGLDLEILALSMDDLTDALGDIAQDTARGAMSTLGMNATDDIVDVVNERAVNWATNRAADLVSFDDLDPVLAETTRDMLRATISQGLKDNIGMPAIADLLEDNYAFSAERAQVIAATEVTSANSAGALEGYKEAKEVGIDVGKSWLRLGDACDVCVSNAAAGTIALDEDFPSGDPHPGAHPHCRCVLVPEVRELSKLAKFDNQNEMAEYFPVDTSLRGSIWANSGSPDEASAEREACLLMFVPFDKVIATQDYLDRDKVTLYELDPTAKGFAPTAYELSTGEYALQDGHHRAVASLKSGNAGMTMHVRRDAEVN